MKAWDNIRKETVTIEFVPNTFTCVVTFKTGQQITRLDSSIKSDVKCGHLKVLTF